MKKLHWIMFSLPVVAALLLLSTLPSLAQSSFRGEEPDAAVEDPEPAPPPIDWATVSIIEQQEGGKSGSAAPPAAVPAPPPATAPNAAAAGATYTVQAGDTLYEIARRFGVSLSDLIAANQIADPRMIQPGQVLLLPQATKPVPQPPPVTGGETYVVQAGDTLSRIARRLGVALADLVAANGITDPNRIRVGQVLQVPQTAVSPPAPTPAPTPDPGSTTTYTVAPGDSLFLIANRFGVTVQAIVQANAIPDPRLIQVGQQLLIPTPATLVPTPAEPAAGTFIWPTERRALYRYFGSYHRAIDIDVAMHSPVVAAAGGTVEFAGWNSSGYGYLVVLDHGGGVRTLYAHNAELKVSTGDSVNQGDLIALSGSTGYSTAPHVHFVIMVHGQSVNPCLHLPDGCG